MFDWVRNTPLLWISITVLCWLVTKTSSISLKKKFTFDSSTFVYSFSFSEDALPQPPSFSLSVTQAHLSILRMLCHSHPQFSRAFTICAYINAITYVLVKQCHYNDIFVQNHSFQRETNECSWKRTFILVLLKMKQINKTIKRWISK